MREWCEKTLFRAIAVVMTGFLLSGLFFILRRFVVGSFLSKP